MPRKGFFNGECSEKRLNLIMDNTPETKFIISGPSLYSFPPARKARMPRKLKKKYKKMGKWKIYFSPGIIVKFV